MESNLEVELQDAERQTGAELPDFVLTTRLKSYNKKNYQHVYLSHTPPPYNYTSLIPSSSATPSQGHPGGFPGYLELHWNVSIKVTDLYPWVLECQVFWESI